MSFIPRTVGGRIRLHSLLMVGVPLIFATVVLLVFIKGAILDTSRHRLEEQVASHKVFIENWIDERRNDVKFLAKTYSVRNLEKDRIKSQFTQYVQTHEDVSAVVLIGPDGKTQVDTASNIVVDVSDREYFIKGRAGDPHVTKVIIGRTSGKPIIIFSHPVTRPDGSFGGIVFLPSQLTAINELMVNLHFGKTGETYILNSDGFMLTETRYLEELKQQGRVKDTAIMHVRNSSSIYKVAQSGAQPSGTYEDYRSADVLGASQWAKDGDWLIVSEIDYDEAIGPFYPFLWTIIGGFTISLIILTPLAIRVERSIELPLKRISHLSERMTRGEFGATCSDVNEYDPPLEVLQMVDAFCIMQEKVDDTMRQLEASAITDQLTGLPNRRFLMKEGARLVDIAMRAKQPCTVFMMDIDHFNDINDTYGHAVGDKVLQQIAETFTDLIRASDIVARYGGEEFVLVAPGSDLDASLILAERIRHGVASRTFNTDEVPLACSISIGLAHYASDIRFGVDAYEDMLSRADESLYEAKKAGRNTVRVSRPS